MTTQNQNEVQSQDQALIDNLFSEFDLDLDGADAVADLIEGTAVAAEPAAEEIDLDALNELELEAAAEPAAAVEAVAEAVEPAIIPPCEDDVEFDFAFDAAEAEAIAAEAAVLEATAAVEKEPKAAKAVKPKASSGGNRVTYYNSSKSTVLLDRLGGNKELIILEASDLELSKEELQQKRQYLLDVMNYQPISLDAKGDPVKSTGLNGETVQKKVAEKVIQLFTYLNKGGKLNKVMQLAFQTLITDGHLSFGKQGNLYAVLRANEYSDGTARAQSGQIQKLFPLLKVTLSDNGALKQNPESIILAKMNADLFPDQAAA